MEDQLNDLVTGETAAPPAVEPQKTEVQPPAPTPPQEQEVVPKAALLEERRKRQEMERQLQAQQQQGSKAIDFSEDPVAAFKNLQSETDRKLLETRLEMSEITARAAYKDFDEVVAAFEAAGRENPLLIQAMTRHPHPAEFAYKEGKKLRALSAIGDLDTYEQRLREKIEKELAEKAAAPAPLPPKPLSTARDAGSGAPPKWSPKPSNKLWKE